MFSLQTIFGKGDRFYGLLEASADAARQSTRALIAMLNQKSSSPSLEEFRLARRREKEVINQISQALVNTFVTALDREDIEALSAALYKIPKTVEKFAERYAMFAEQLMDVDYVARAALLEKATGIVVEMVGQLRRGMKLEEMKALNDRMQAIESEADRLLLALYKDLFANEANAARLLLRKDLFELLEKAIDRCRDVGNVIYAIVLKNS
ncbi:MAG TPA: pit accessory protein [Rudaea sp.]|nr:pit accessory protein [Rudaea sp.]